MAYSYRRRGGYRRRPVYRKRYGRKRTYRKRTYRKRTYRRPVYRKRYGRKRAIAVVRPDKKLPLSKWTVDHLPADVVNYSNHLQKAAREVAEVIASAAPATNAMDIQRELKRARAEIPVSATAPPVVVV